ncbi:MAG: peptidoglycan bridge formation glycyltransferase FemA/FemB family protein [Chloroflexi bacterium]|nr:peptidoglycan bridge formation glycyltransferase FemA/FemB family protein [Chloroflexota bacterium]
MVAEGRPVVLGAIPPSASDAVSAIISNLVDPQTWDSFVASSPHGHLLQSFAWGVLKSRFGWQAERILHSQGGRITAAQVLYRKTPIGSFAYIPRGPVADLDDRGVLSDLLADVHRQARRKGAIFLRIEPDRADPGLLPALGFQASGQSTQPRATVVVDLRPDLEQVQAQQHPKTRYNTRLATRKGVQVREAGLDDLPVFYSLLETTSARDRFAIHSYAYYQAALTLLGENARFFLATFQGEPLAGIIVAAFGEDATYLYGASGNAHRNLMPNHLLQWQAMCWAKRRGCARYDLWGIPEVAPDEKPQDAEAEDKGMAGLYRFKRGFGGQVLHYAGGYDYVYSPPRYILWRQVLRWMRRFKGGHET